jgi:tetratricopeptide (TPR) repeat protein
MLRFWGIFFLLLSLQSHAQRGGDVITIDDTVGNSYALVVGISNYQNIKSLIYADDDAEAFAAWLIEQEICQRKNVKRLIDSEATAANFYLELERFLTKLQANDRLYIYFAGHGDVENKIQAGFLLCYGTRPSPYAGSDVIDINMLENYVNAFVGNRVKVVLITDACRSGNLAGGMAGVTNTLRSIDTRFQNVIKMLSCQPNQLSQEKPYPGGGHGVFTYHLLNGLYGLADRDGDDRISLRELDLYMDEVSKETGEQQIPKIDGNPVVKLVKYNESLKKLAVAKMKNADVTGGRINGRNRNDTSWSNDIYYQRFRKAIRELDLTGPYFGSAEDMIQTAEMNKAPADMVADMKLELSAVLEDQLQKWLNTYLRGELENKSVSYEHVSDLADYATLLEKLTPKSSLRYKEIHAKNIFFEIYHNWSYRKQDQYINYINQLKEADKLVPNQPWIQHLIGTVYHDLHDDVNARIYYTKAMSLAPKWNYPLINRGITYLDHENYKQAEEDFRAALLLDPTNAVTAFDLGLTYSRQKRLRESDSCYKLAVQIDSSYVPAWTSLAYNAIRDSLYNKAETYLTIAQKVDSNEYSIYTTLGILKNTQKDTVQAQAFYERAVNVEPYEAYPRQMLAYFLFNHRKWEEAIEKLQEAYRVDSLDQEVIETIGLTYLHLQNHKEADKWFKKAGALGPFTTATLHDMGITYLDQGRYDKAETYFRQLAEKEPDYAWAWMELGYSVQLQKKYKQAKALYYKTISLYKESYYALYHLAEIAVIENETDSAIHSVMLALQYYPEYKEASQLADSLVAHAKNNVTKLALSKIAENDFKAAMVYFRKFTAQYPQDHEFAYQFASALAAKNESLHALEILEEMIRKGFRDVNRIEADPNFINVRKFPGFQELMKKAR